MSRGVLIVRRSDNEMKRNAEVGRFTKSSTFPPGSGRFQANRRRAAALRDPKGGLPQLIRDEIRAQVVGGKRALGLATVAGPDQDGSLHARVPGAFDVFHAVADHHGGGKVDPVPAPGCGEQAGPGLAAGAVLGGQVGADQNVADDLREAALWITQCGGAVPVGL